MTRPKEIWFITINLYGLSSKRPMRGYWDLTNKRWWDKTGNIGVNSLGLFISESKQLITFASKDKHKVALFVQGARAMSYRMRNLVWTE
jgi:hypothetical protein